MIEKIEEFLKKYDFATSEKRLLVGFSGGWDSMALLDCLIKLREKFNYDLIAVHFNHNWRGEESDAEALNCKNFADRNHVEFYCEKASRDCKKTETAARELRYSFFEDCKNKFNADAIFTAHTKSDNVETLIYRIAKGTGINGLEGIKEHRDYFYRPLLDVSREEIKKYCGENKLSPNCDSSNENNKYKRNLIRNKIIKELKEINPSVENSISALSKLAEENIFIINEYLSLLKENLFENDCICSKEFSKLSTPVQKRIVYEVFLKENIDYTQEKIVNALDFILKNLSNPVGSMFSLSNTKWIFANSEKIEIINKVEKIEDEVIIDVEGKYEFKNVTFELKKVHSKPANYPLDKDLIAYVDLSSIEFPLILRTRRNGDVISPLGMSGCMKLKKYLTSKKISKFEKDKIILICKGSEILWVSSLGISDKIKVVNNPTHVLSLKNRESEGHSGA